MNFKCAGFALLVGLLFFLSADVLSQTKAGTQRKIVRKTSKKATLEKERGVKLPVVTLVGNEGLKELIKPKGKPILINFWATWCDVCREEFPDLVRIYQDYGDRIDVVVVSLDYPVEINRDVPKFLAEVNAWMPAYLLKSEDENMAASIVSEKWQGGLPFTILFNTDGKEVYSYQGRFNNAVLRRKIEDLISAKSQ